MKYILNPDKTEDLLYTTSLNCLCDADEAYLAMKMIYEHYSGKSYDAPLLKSGKNSVKAIHYIQSFSPDDNVTPESAHRMAKAFARKMFGDDVQVVIATHVDKKHIHSHIVINSYSVTGQKYYDNWITREKAREYSDRVCLAFGIQPIQRKPGRQKSMKYNEWEHKKRGTSWKQKIRNEIDSIITSVRTVDELYDELEKNVSLRVEDTDSTDRFKVSGRGELHLSILIETMRREGYEFAVSKPEVILKKINEELCEPYENLIVDVPDEYAGSAIERLSNRKGEMKDMKSAKGRTHLTFHIPARGLIGFRNEFIRMTRGEGIMYHTFLHYRPYAGDIPKQRSGSLIALEQGEAIPYALAQFEDRGVFFVTPKTKVYRGMIIGEGNRPQDIVVNICKTKRLTNMRSSTADVMVTLQAPRKMELEDALEYIENDGKQTPMRGHPVFISQHATATCCRGCLYKWHHISKNRKLTSHEIDFIVCLIMEWIKKDL